jgi:ribosomal protein L40E
VALTKKQLDALPTEAVDDVIEYLIENKSDRSVDQLTPKEFFDSYLVWNGIIGYSTSLAEIFEVLGWKLKEAPPTVMTPEDRLKILSVLKEQYSKMYSDCKQHEVVEELVEAVFNGVSGLVETSDKELLGEVGQPYIDGDGTLCGTPGDDYNPTNDEAFRIWASYVRPEILCKECFGSGTIGEQAEKCTTCGGTGLRPSEVLP